MEVVEILLATFIVLSLLEFIVIWYALKGWDTALKGWRQELAIRRDELIKEIMSYPPSPERNEMVSQLRAMTIKGEEECVVL